MDTTGLFGQVLNQIPEAKAFQVGAAFEEFLEIVKTSKTSSSIETISTTGWTSTTNNFSVPDNVFTVHKVYVDGEPVEMDLTEEEVLSGVYSDTTPRCLVHGDGTIYFNFYLHDGSTASTVKLSCTVYDTAITASTLPDRFKLAALYFILYSLYSMKEYRDEALASTNYSKYLSAYEKVKYKSPAVTVFTLGEDF